MVECITKICKTYGPRIAGSEGDKNSRVEIFKDTQAVCDETKVENFKCSDKAFMAWVPIGVILLIMSTIFYVFSMPIISLCLTVVTLFLILTEFIFYKETLDVFFPKKETANVVGIRKASGETKRRIILCGHTDCAFEWTYTYFGGRPADMTIIASAVLNIVASIAGSITSIVTQGAFNPSFVFSNANTSTVVFATIMTVLLPIMIAAVFFCNFSKPVAGANDNLTGCYIPLAVAKYLDDNDIHFENTEVQIALVGAEECGLRGSKDYAVKHKEEYLNDDTQTIVVALDTIHDFEFMKILLCDMNGTVKNDPRVANLIKEGAQLAGYGDIAMGTIDLGSTDAAAFSLNGYPASSLLAVDPAPARYYHTRLDNEDCLDENAIEAGFKITLETVFLFDKKGI